MINKAIEIRIKNQIERYIDKQKFAGTDIKVFGKPIIGFSNGSDSLYSFIKQDIGEFYWTPKEAFMLQFPEDIVLDGSLTVISWILPQTKLTKSTQNKKTKYPSNEWVSNRIEGEEVNNNLKRYIIDEIKSLGYKAMSPTLLKQWNNHHSDKYGYASNWSERHVAYISGLGTFGLCDGLITEVGKAHRCGSVVAYIELEPTKRNYETHNQYCLHYSSIGCRRCIERCPTGAISENGHDKRKCNKYKKQEIRSYVKKEYLKESACCGLCQTDVPCESGIPITIAP